MITMTKRIEFDAGHRLMNHESKCRNLHGHRYAVEVTIAMPDRGLDIAGRIVDFGEVKRILGGWIDDNLDHGFIANAADVDVIEFVRSAASKLYVVDFEPSAENLSAMLLMKARELMPDFSIVSIVIFETPTSSAEAT